MKHKADLLPFYFGSLSDDDRLLVERELLTDPEALTDYLDLKRALEAATQVPQAPSTALRLRLRGKVSQKKTFISISIGIAIAATIALIVLAHFKTGSPKSISTENEILFDSSREPHGASHVL